MDMMSDLGRFTPPVDGFGLDNLFDSNPDYDEASGPPRDEHYFLVEEFSEDWDEDDEKDYQDRILFQDPDEPLGPGETRDSVIRDIQSLATHITVDPDYEPNCGPAKVAVRYFNGADTLPAVDELVIMPITVFNQKSMRDKKAKRWIMILSTTVVTVRGKRH